MAKTLEFLFDVGSPTTYLAHKRMPDLIARTGAEVIYVPVLLGGIFKATGNASPVTIPAKGAWMTADMSRFAKKFGVSLNFNPFFPINTITMMRMIAGAVGEDSFPTLVDTLFDGMWKSRKNLGDPEVLKAVLDKAGLDAAALLAVAETQDAKDTLKTNTETAVARGAFGAPTFFVEGEMFFGQDRLDFVEEALTA